MFEKPKSFTYRFEAVSRFVEILWRVGAPTGSARAVRTDRGGPDTPFTKEDLIRDFQALAFYGEYVSGQGFTKAIEQPTELSKWEDPVRVRLLFGPSVSVKTREADRQTVTELLDRLTNVTRHPILLVEDNSNFDVLVANEDERNDMTQLQHQRHPIGHQTASLLKTIPRELQCVVLAYSSAPFLKNTFKPSQLSAPNIRPS